MTLTLPITYCVFSVEIEILNLFLFSVHFRKLIKGKKMISYDLYLKHELRKKSFHNKCTIYASFYVMIAQLIIYILNM